MKMGIERMGLMAILMLALALPRIAAADPLTVNEIIFQSGSGVNSSLYAGTVDVTGYGSSTLTFVVRNTSANGAVTDPNSTAQMLLTGIGWLSSQGIGSVAGSITAGSSALNFGSGATINNQWAYANSTQIDGFGALGTGVNHVLTTVDHQVGLVDFDGGSETVDGPAYGMVSASETQFGTSLAGVNDSITFSVTFGSVVNKGDLSDLVLAFGSPNSAATPDGGATVALLGIAFLGLGALRRKIGKN
jgi:hypothetical protein